MPDKIHRILSYPLVGTGGFVLSKRMAPDGLSKAYWTRSINSIKSKKPLLGKGFS